ncbi:hypothetical protein VNO80_30512 [Phaseolus coccineus]|uniref:Uncharacterized protein n=1 Tax=Phaseolus coccineus TaxID=3886 RepID=A0AAN9LD26_PHACN
MVRRNKAIVAPTRRKAPSQDARETSRSNLAKRARKDKFLSISDPKYSWVLGEVISHAFEFTLRDTVKEFKLLAKFGVPTLDDAPPAKPKKGDEVGTTTISLGKTPQTPKGP